MAIRSTKRVLSKLDAVVVDQLRGDRPGLFISPGVEHRDGTDAAAPTEEEYAWTGSSLIRADGCLSQGQDAVQVDANGPSLGPS